MAQTLFVSVDDAATWTPAPAQLVNNPNVTAFATDKADRLLAATTGGLLGLDDPTAKAPDGGLGDGGAAGGGATDADATDTGP